MLNYRKGLYLAIELNKDRRYPETLNMKSRKLAYHDEYMEMNSKKRVKYHLANDQLNEKDSLQDSDQLKVHGCAVWDIFRRQDVSKLIEYLQKHRKEFLHINNLPINSVSSVVSLYHKFILGKKASFVCVIFLKIVHHIHDF